ncbi:hypothetical protein [Ruegeria atlantica]|uniref:Uncharacterized protein n=1 Tax=Ruegeria atlantica TaxID=81569 RepID=A0A0P1EBS8_9RHOB|nr:hypothetical protein [Ruegeria atlantica]CUH47018.1 hypothetical protein RUA4292_01185 [Ruegeria atlantica]
MQHLRELAPDHFRVGLESALRQRSGATLGHAPEAAIPETQMLQQFQGRNSTP